MKKLLIPQQLVYLLLLTGWLGSCCNAGHEMGMQTADGNIQGFDDGYISDDDDEKEEEEKQAEEQKNDTPDEKTQKLLPQLEKLCESKDFATVEKLIKENYVRGKQLFFSISDYDGRQPLYMACRYAPPQVLQLLLKHIKQIGEVNFKEESGYSWQLLYCACKHGLLKKVKILLDYIDVNTREYMTKNSLLHCDSLSNYPEPKLVELLLECPNIKVNVRDQHGATPLHSACISKRPELVKLLLKSSEIDVNAKDKDGDTPLHWASEYSKNPEVVALLLYKLAWGDQYRKLLASGFVREVSKEPPAVICEVISQYVDAIFMPDRFPAELGEQQRKALWEALNTKNKKGELPIDCANRLDVSARTQIVKLLKEATALCRSTSQQQNDSND